MTLLIAAFVAFVVALFTASTVLKARQGADTARIALLEQRVEELTHRLGGAPAPLAVPFAAPSLGPNLGPNLGPTQPGTSTTATAGLPADSLSSTVAALVARGKKIEAIKVYRDQTGVGLKEAKDAVERIERQGF